MDPRTDLVGEAAPKIPPWFRRTDRHGRTTDGRTTDRRRTKKIRTKKFRRKNSDEKIRTKKNQTKKKIGGEARGQGTAAAEARHG